MFFFDVVLPFGSSSSPFLFCMVSDAVEWDLRCEFGSLNVLHYMDDFPFIDPQTRVNASYSFQFLAHCYLLGVPLAADKAEGPSPILTFLGIEINPVLQTMRLPQAKFSKTMSLLKDWSCKRSCTRAELQSITGSLEFAATCVPAGRRFVGCMIKVFTDHREAVGRIPGNGPNFGCLFASETILFR